MKRPTNPIVPANTQERTGAMGILRRAVREIRRRYAGLQVDVLAIFDGIRIYSANDAQAITLYGLTPDELAATSQALQDALDRWLLEGRQAKHTFWYGAYDEEAAQLGSAQSAANLTRLSEGYAASRSLQQIVFSDAYRNRVGMAQVKSYEHWTGLAAEARADLSQIIGRAVVDGKNPKAVRTEIMERLDVSKSRAAQYAQTDITDTLRQARMAEADYASESLGLNLGLLWTSAFLPTTRPWHASRSGNVYTSAEVRAFYDTGGNRYRCFLPGTTIAGRFVGGLKAHYKGPTVRLVTAGGGDLTVTANHPVYANGRLVPAAQLKEGDELVRDGREIGPALGIGELHGRLVETTAEQVFRALVQAGHQSPARVSPVDLHGDGRLCNEDVQVVRTDGVLAFGMDAARAKLLDDVSFELADAPSSSLGTGDALLHANFSRAGGAMGGAGVRQPFVGAELLHPVPLTVAAVPGGDTGGNELGDQALSTDPGSLRDAQHGLPREVFRDVLLRVEFGWYEGHVYDFQEWSGLMLGSGILASNCHCATTECLLDTDGVPILTQSLKDKMKAEKVAWQKTSWKAS